MIQCVISQRAMSATPAIARAPIIIVSGLPRSGTSLVMQMLSAGGLPTLTDHLRAPDSDNPRGYFEFERVKQIKADKTWLDGAAGKAVKIIHLLLTDLPDDREYRVIMLRRDLSEVVRSQARMLERLGRQGASMSDERLMAIYASQMRTVAAWLKARPNFAVCELEYAGIVADPQAAASTLAEFLRLPIDLSAMAAAVDPNLYRNRTQAK